MGPSVDLFTLAHLLSLCLASSAARRSAFGRGGGLGGLSHQWEGGERHLAGGSCPTIWDSYPLGDPQWWQSRAEQPVLDLSWDLSRPAGVSVPYSLYIAAVFSF